MVLFVLYRHKSRMETVYKYTLNWRKYSPVCMQLSSRYSNSRTVHWMFDGDTVLLWRCWRCILKVRLWDFPNTAMQQNPLLDFPERIKPSGNCFAQDLMIWWLFAGRTVYLISCSAAHVHVCCWGCNTEVRIKSFLDIGCDARKAMLQAI